MNAYINNKSSVEDVLTPSAVAVKNLTLNSSSSSVVEAQQQREPKRYKFKSKTEFLQHNDNETNESNERKQSADNELDTPQTFGMSIQER